MLCDLGALGEPDDDLHHLVADGDGLALHAGRQLDPVLRHLRAHDAPPAPAFAGSGVLAKRLPTIRIRRLVSGGAGTNAAAIMMTAKVTAFTISSTSAIFPLTMPCSTNTASCGP